MIKSWWAKLNTFNDVEVPIMQIKKYLVQMRFTPDVETAEVVISKILGKQSLLDFEKFYKLFGKSIFRIALIDLLNSIEMLSQDQQELPLLIKLGEFRRNILLAGLDQKSGEVSIRGKSILDAMRVFKDEIEPGFLQQFNFNQFVLDPMK